MRRYTTPTLPMTVPVDLTGAEIHVTIKQAEITGDTGRSYYAIKLMDSTGTILKSEERDLSAMRS